MGMDRKMKVSLSAAIFRVAALAPDVLHSWHLFNGQGEPRDGSIPPCGS
jgi:hypothetical protein